LNYFNYPLAPLLKLALGKQVVSRKLALDPRGLLSSDSLRFCYSVVLPASYSLAQERAFVADDLRRWLAVAGIAFRTDTLPWPCLVLQPQQQGRLLPGRRAPRRGRLTDEGGTEPDILSPLYSPEEIRHPGA